MNINKFEEILSWDLGDYWYERTPLEKNRVISSLLTQQRTELLEEIKKDFEANVLDGDELEDCGKAMISSEAILDWLKILENK